MKIGYIRISTKDQTPARQLEALAAHCDEIRTEQASATKARPVFDAILENLKAGDTLVILDLDRAFRSTVDALLTLDRLKEKGAHLAATEQPVDTSTATGKAFFDMLGVFAEFETNLRRERQAEGIKAAKRKGVYRGRPPKIDMATIQAKLGAGLSPTEIAREMGISRGTVYKAKAEMLTGNDIVEGRTA